MQQTLQAFLNGRLESNQLGIEEVVILLMIVLAGLILLFLFVKLLILVVRMIYFVIKNVTLFLLSLTIPAASIAFQMYLGIKLPFATTYGQGLVPFVIWLAMVFIINFATAKPPANDEI